MTKLAVSSGELIHTVHMLKWITLYRPNWISASHPANGIIKPTVVCINSWQIQSNCVPSMYCSWCKTKKVKQSSFRVAWEMLNFPQMVPWLEAFPDHFLCDAGFVGSHWTVTVVWIYQWYEACILFVSHCWTYPALLSIVISTLQAFFECLVFMCTKPWKISQCN